MKHNISLANFKAVIFDMDGTMIDNMPYHQQAWQKFLEQHDMHLSEEKFKEKIAGKKNDQIFAIIFGGKLTNNEVAKYTDEKEALYRELYTPHIKEVAGLGRIIELIRARHLKTAIATTAPEKNRTFSLGLAGKFDVTLGDEHVTNGKPHPEIYLSTAQKLGVNPVECLVFEDTVFGVEAAKNAGMTVVGILTSHSVHELARADFHAANFEDIILT
jgi:beta-phosphoglucomutase